MSYSKLSGCSHAVPMGQLPANPQEFSIVRRQDGNAASPPVQTIYMPFQRLCRRRPARWALRSHPAEYEPGVPPTRHVQGPAQRQHVALRQLFPQIRKSFAAQSPSFSANGNGMADIHFIASTAQRLSGTPRKTSPQPECTRAAGRQIGRATVANRAANH